MTRSLVALLLALFLPRDVHAYTIATGFTPGCHERITERAYDDFLLGLGGEGVTVPAGGGEEENDDDATWRRAGAFLVDQVGIDPADLSEEQFFILTSLLVGVRSPDTEGHAVLNLETSRDLHTDPTPEGQYAHALRAISDDGEGADLSAVSGTRARIISEMAEAVRRVEQDEQNVTAALYFDFYGVVDVEVWGPAFHIGRAAHALQDSFSHTIRDEADEFRTILTVTNFAEAVTGTLVEERDGLPHSVSMDECGEATEPVVEAATQATRALFVAARDQLRGRNPAATDDLVDGWVRFRPGCNVANGFCGNERWLEVLRREPTTPFLCSASWGGRPFGSKLADVLARAVVALAFLRVMRRRRKKGAT
ncbi:MAG: hypothetical protein AAF938_23305 [Myxococcota bacterium]